MALVAGATRGAGRGIATELALAGALVYCTGRSSRAEARPPRAGAAPFDLARRPETIEETAELIAAAGGRAVGVRVDHSDPAAVGALVERIRAEQGRLDVLVNDVWGGDALTEWGTPLAQMDLGKGLELFTRAVHTHLITARLALPLIPAGGSIIEVTDGDGLYYRGSLFYDLAKTTVIRLAFALSEELRDQRVTAVAVTPGFLRSEAMLEHFGVTEATWREGASKDPHFLHSESPRYVGRAVAALAGDPEVLSRSGGLYSSWGLAAEYGFTDVDGARPDWGAHAAAQPFGAAQRASHARFVGGSRVVTALSTTTPAR